jgi:LemA protein
MKNKFAIGIGIIGLLVLFWCWSSYNTLVKDNLAVDTQWAQVETQYQRRFDLIPGLVSSVSGVMKQEKDVFSAIANARQGYAGARTVDEKVAAANQVESSLSRLLVITENYPQLKSSETMQTFMAQLEGTENRISVERMRFNTDVQAYNGAVMSFPGNIMAKLFSFKVRAPFTVTTKDAENAPTVKFTN